MATDRAQQRQEIHLILDVVPEDKLVQVRNLLNELVDPLEQMLATIPYDDEELNEETIVLIQKSRLNSDPNDLTSHEDMMKEFGA